MTCVVKKISDGLFSPLRLLPPKRNVQNTQNKYLKNNLLPKSVKKRKVQ